MPEDARPAESRVIDVIDPDKLREAADQLRCEPEMIAEAVAKVGPNRIAVELYLSAPRA